MRVIDKSLQNSSGPTKNKAYHDMAAFVAIAFDAPSSRILDIPRSETFGTMRLSISILSGFKSL